jgi:SecD/SecF fusion protein
MNRRVWNWVIIAVVAAIALINPLYRLKSHQPIVTLGLDLRGGVEVLLHAVPEDGSLPTQDQISGAMLVVRNRVDPQGQKEINLTQVGQDRILLQVPGEKNPDSIIEVIGETALLEFVNTADRPFTEGEDLNEPGSSKRKEEFAKYETILKGADLKRADVQFQSTAHRPYIAFEFKPQAADKFGQYTNDHVGQYLTILLDGKVLTSPVIKSAIWGGHGMIEGQFTIQEANKIVNQLNAGALPVPLTILSSSVVGPTLGQESINKSLLAGIVGFAIVLLFMLLFYRLPGLVANAALCLYVVIVLGYLSLINATMTLPGIAGFLLSVGMAIDGNIIIFERLKEEIRWGKTLVAAMEAAFARAWAAILDGNLTTLLAAAVLYFYGSGPVKGFAITLFIGNIAALFSAVFVTRHVMDVVTRRVRETHLYATPVKRAYLPGEILREGKYYRFVERTPMWAAISAVIICAGLVFMYANQAASGSPFNLGIDYTGGEQLILEAKQPFSEAGQEVSRIVQKYSEGDPVVQVDLNDLHIVSIRMRLKTSGTAEDEKSRNRTASLRQMKEEIGSAFGGYVAEGSTGANPVVREQNYVGPTVGAELIRNAILALIIGCVLIIVYIFIRFASWPMGVGGVLALVHDVLLTLAFTAALHLEVNSSFIAVILTIIGYSINDTVIVFDRVRENLRSFGESAPFGQLCNMSISQTFVRSINTVLTVLVMTAALLLLGGSNIRAFMAAMFIGLISGMYSSIYIATPLMLWFSRGKLRFAEEPAVTGAAPAYDATFPAAEELPVSRTIREAVAKKEKAAKKQRRR